MTTLLHVAGMADTAFAWISAAWLSLGEVFTVGALLLMLDRIAAAIKATYQAGQAVGAFWFNHGLPAFLWLADSISWLLAQVDWVEVGHVVADSLRTIAALFLTACSYIVDAADAAHAAWIGSDWSFDQVSSVG